MSRIDVISKPEVFNARIADSLPEPGPFTNTSTRFNPKLTASVAAVVDATCAAYGVLLRDPLKPSLPEEDHDMQLPYWSVTVTITLLNVARIKTIPFDSTNTFFFPNRPLRPLRTCLFAIIACDCCNYLRGAFFLPATVFLRPLRVLAFVCVR